MAKSQLNQPATQKHLKELEGRLKDKLNEVENKLHLEIVSTAQSLRNEIATGDKLLRDEIAAGDKSLRDELKAEIATGDKLLRDEITEKFATKEELIKFKDEILNAIDKVATMIKDLADEQASNLNRFDRIEGEIVQIKEKMQIA